MMRGMPETAKLPNDLRRLLLLGGGSVAAFLLFVISWATLAEITTTLRVPGELNPKAPTHEVQHEEGGRVASLHVALHEEVERGDLLLSLDVSDEILQRDAARARAEILEAEIAAISPRLGLSHTGGEVIESVSLAYAAQDDSFEAQVAQFQAEEDGLTRRAEILFDRYLAQRAFMDVTRERHARSAELARKGLMPKAQYEAILRELHDGESALLAIDAEAIELSNRRRDLTASRTRLEEERREGLTAKRLAHAQELIDTNARIARLNERISRAQVFAPVAGKVTDLAIETPGIVAAPGATLVTLSQPLDELIIDLHVEPSFIDQVRAGQEGLLTINSLPQRTAPKLRVVLTDIAREPAKDQQGNPSFYLARALMNSDDMRAAEESLGDIFQLSAGMPVSAALSGRNTTLWTFVTGPFTGLLGAAFED